ncbi:MAG: ABC transporter permease subunit [Thermodesulfobacteriota bacterium]
MQPLDRQFIKKVRRQDRIATRVITVGGLLVIASVIAILVLIVRVTLPLFLPASAEVVSMAPVTSPGQVMAVGVDDQREVGYTLDDQGIFRFTLLPDGRPLLNHPLARSGQRIKAIDASPGGLHTLLWGNNAVTLARVDFRLLFDQHGKRTVQPEVSVLHELPPMAYAATPVQAMARRDGDGGLRLVIRLADNSFQVTSRTVATDLFGNTKEEIVSFPIRETIPGAITACALDAHGNALYAGTDTGSLLRWELDAATATARRTDNVIATGNRQAITALALVLGDVSVAVGDAGGGMAIWSPIWSEEGERVQKLRKIHTLTSHPKPVLAIIPGHRSKTLLSLDAGGRASLDHMTSENHLLTLDSDLALVSLTGPDNTLAGLDRAGNFVVAAIDNPHPEVSLKTLFGAVWYESYDHPAHVWQSSSGTDDFEPKFSITPLLFGTMKGTLYAMLFAVPLAIFGAVYTSQFTTFGFRKTIKPVVEIMASVPSVVIGFLVALWLAPLVESAIMAVILGVLLLPVVFVLLMSALRPFYKTPTLQNRCTGYEFLLLLPVLALSCLLAAWLAPLAEQLLFAGDFKQWLFSDLGMRYDQRNSIIIAFGLGIAVIPIIFSITEDAISNIPPSLTAASLALGASRWQTIWRVVLPSASPGIFAAIMIGFGRAVGETMIVLMATGNTPIIDWSIFNGMRTLSANIAVEIPEAPVGGTLYRVLFLCATLLFALTFVLNTGAEVIRERLRKKYGRY